MRKAMYRGAIGHVSHCDRACFKARKGIFRHRKRHVSQQEIRNREPETGHSNDNRLNVRRIHKHNENRVFSPHRLLIEKKCVVFTIVCCLFSTILRKLWRCLRCSQTAKRAMALAFSQWSTKRKRKNDLASQNHSCTYIKRLESQPKSALTAARGVAVSRLPLGTRLQKEVKSIGNEEIDDLLLHRYLKRTDGGVHQSSVDAHEGMLSLLHYHLAGAVRVH